MRSAASPAITNLTRACATLSEATLEGLLPMRSSIQSVLTRTISSLSTRAPLGQQFRSTPIQAAAAAAKTPSPSLSATSRQRTLSTQPLPTSSSSIAPATPGARSGSSRNNNNRAGWTRGLLIIPPAVAALLGKWQLDRRQWKIDLLERRKRMMQGEAINIFADNIEIPEEYQRVRAVGTFDYSKTQYIGPRPRSSMGTTERGYLMVTPLRDTSTGRAVMVMRGWAPYEWRTDPQARAGGEPQGEVVIEGVVRGGENPGSFVPANSPSEGSWFFVDPVALAAAAGLPEGTPLVEVVAGEEGTRLVNPGGPPTAMEVLGGRAAARGRRDETYPLPKSEGDMMAFSVMPRDHANYATTWFTLSGATALLAVKALRRRRGGGVSM